MDSEWSRAMMQAMVQTICDTYELVECNKKQRERVKEVNEKSRASTMVNGE